VRVLQQSSLITLDHSDDMLSVVNAEIKEGGFQVQGISDDCIKEPSIIEMYALQEPFRRNDLSFPRPKHLYIQRDSQIEPDQMADHASVVIFDLLSAMNLDLSLRAAFTTPISTGKKIHVHRTPQTAMAPLC